MTAVPLEPSARYAALRDAVEQLQRDHVSVTVTQDGEPVAVLVDPEEFAALRETVDILRTPGEAEAINEGLADLEAGREVDGPAFLKTFRSRQDDRA